MAATPPESPGSPSVGFIGLGSQGAPMARRIIESGFATTLWARRAESLEPFADTAATVAASPRELGAACDVVCVCVVDDAGVDQVLRGPDGAAAGMAAGGVLAIHSTVHPDTCRRLQDDFPHLQVIDATVSGGGHKAAEGELLVMTGGPPDAVERCRPVFETYGNPILHVGGLGAAQEAKLLNNTVFAANLGVVAAAFEVAASRGIDPDALTGILAAGSGSSFAAQVLGPRHGDLGAMAGTAGPLLAKDVGILDRLEPSTYLVDAARAALQRMGVAPA